MPIKIGTYSPDGTDNYAVTGVGFAPDFVLTGQGTGTTLQIIRHKDMGAGNSYQWSGTAAALTDGIKSLDSDGFTLGTNAAVNVNATTFYYVAIKEEAGAIEVGNYACAGASDKAVTGVGFQPAMVWVKTVGASIRDGAFGTATSVADNYSFIVSNTAATPTGLKSLDADGFTALGGNNPWNAASSTAYFVAFLGGTNVMYQSKYTGDGSSPKTVSGAGFQPTWAIATGTGAVHKYAKHVSHSGSNSKPIAGVAVSTTYTTGFHSDGITVQSSVNAGSTTYYWIALRDSPPMPSTTAGAPTALALTGYAHDVMLAHAYVQLGYPPAALGLVGAAHDVTATAPVVIPAGLLTPEMRAALRRR